jgi:hypothetical protein
MRPSRISCSTAVSPDFCRLAKVSCRKLIVWINAVPGLRHGLYFFAALQLKIPVRFHFDFEKRVLPQTLDFPTSA